MATDFAARVPTKKIAWAHDTWSAAREQMFHKKFTGKGSNNVIQRITELTRDERGERCIFQLVADLVRDGRAGDDQREGFEEDIENFWQEIGIGLLSHQVRNKGKLANQKTVLNFREYAKDKLSYWLADRMDQLVFLTLAGVAYTYRLDGRLRDENTFMQLDFAADNTPITSKRHMMWTGSALLQADTTTLTSSAVLSYNALLELKTYAIDHYIKPLRQGGKEYFIVFLQPGAMTQLKQDPAFQRAIIHALPKGESNPWFTGATVTVDGLVLHEHRYVYSNRRAGAGLMWGATGNVPGTRTQLCGAQAMAMTDLGAPEWEEERFDYKTKQGISIDKFFGLLRPKFRSIYDGTDETFGTVAMDHYLAQSAA